MQPLNLHRILMSNKAPKEESDVLSAFTSSKESAGVMPFCARSDPRMNRALEARLRNPGLTLYECLCIGGFDFREDDAAELDSENVTLTQRKNQLNRRIRALRKRLSGSTQAPTAAASKNTKQAPAEKQEDFKIRAIPEGARSRTMRAGADTMRRGTLSAVAGGVPNTLGLSGEQQLGAATHASVPSAQGDNHDPFNSWETLSTGAVPYFSANQPITLAGNSNNGPSIYSLPAPVGDGRVTFQDPLPGNVQEELLGGSNSSLSIADITNALDNRSALAGGPIPHLPGTRDSDSILFENSLMPATQIPHFHQIGSGAAGLLSFLESNHFQMNGMGVGSDSRQEEALRLFQHDIQSLYNSCMIRAGFLPEERQPTSPSYRAFLSAASEQEWRRRRASNNIGGQR